MLVFNEDWREPNYNCIKNILMKLKENFVFIIINLIYKDFIINDVQHKNLIRKNIKNDNEKDKVKKK